MKLKDLTGQRFGRLTVQSLIGRERSRPGGQLRTYWACLCDCGSPHRAAAGNLVRGSARSCGCRQARETTHGLSGMPHYGVWAGMLRRCRNPESKDYANYGGRGIDVCPRWENVENFVNDMGPRPEGATLERKKNSLGYSPENCEWATRKRQANNHRGNRNLTHLGRAQTVAEWVEELGLNRNTVQGRLRRGLSPEDALTLPVRTREEGARQMHARIREKLK